MARQENFLPKEWRTRRVFVAVIALLAVAMLLGITAGPVLVESDVDPRPYAAILSGATYIAFFGVFGWFAWKMTGGADNLARSLIAMMHSKRSH
jgi:hypothetical protein